MGNTPLSHISPNSKQRVVYAPEDFPLFDGLPSHIGTPEYFTDVIAAITGISELSQVHLSTQREPSRMRILSVKDMAGEELRVVLWGRCAETFNPDAVHLISKEKPVVAIFVGTLVKKYEGERVSTKYTGSPQVLLSSMPKETPTSCHVPESAGSVIKMPGPIKPVTVPVARQELFPAKSDKRSEVVNGLEDGTEKDTEKDGELPTDAAPVRVLHSLGRFMICVILMVCSLQFHEARNLPPEPLVLSGKRAGEDVTHARKEGRKRWKGQKVCMSCGGAYTSDGGGPIRPHQEFRLQQATSAYEIRPVS